MAVAETVAPKGAAAAAAMEVAQVEVRAVQEGWVAAEEDLAAAAVAAARPAAGSAVEAEQVVARARGGWVPEAR